MADYYPILIPVLIILGAIFALRIFFTLWKPVDRHFNGDRLEINKEIHINSLKNQPVSVYLKSGTVIRNVRLKGYCSTYTETPYEFRQLLQIEYPDGHFAYVRISEIEYFEEPSKNHQLTHPIGQGTEGLFEKSNDRVPFR
ncbi:MAG: hypothetical protein HY774_25530 [Acidobacteria bacterium]|nr:hypothetical protein [Acidobacteriota bacterium]